MAESRRRAASTMGDGSSEAEDDVRGSPRAKASDDDRLRAERSERELGRLVAFGLPPAILLCAIAMGFLVGLAPALLVLAGGALLGTIFLFWASLRSLSGDAPLASSFATVAVRVAAKSDGAAERKRAALRSLKDLEFEHSVGKIDDDDYADLVERYRGEAKTLMREMDLDVEPLRGRAEDLARHYLAKRGLGQNAGSVTQNGAEDAPAPEAKPPRSRPPTTSRVACVKCSASNEPDALFCKSCGVTIRRVCGTCNGNNEPDAAFCKKCGAKMDPTERDANEKSDVPA